MREVEILMIENKKWRNIQDNNLEAQAKLFLQAYSLIKHNFPLE